jgi:hypothetical protein
MAKFRIVRGFDKYAGELYEWKSYRLEVKSWFGWKDHPAYIKGSTMPDLMRRLAAEIERLRTIGAKPEIIAEYETLQEIADDNNRLLKFSENKAISQDVQPKV